MIYEFFRLLGTITGIPAELLMFKRKTYYEDKKFKKKMNYANRINVPYVIIIGDDEIDNNKVAIKNFATGEQTVCSVDEAARIIRR